MTVTALFATAGATNAGLFPATGLCENMVEVRQFPPLLGQRLGGRAPFGLVVTAAAAIVLAAGFDLDAVASIGSAIALLVFSLITIGHLRIRAETGANAWLLLLGIATTLIALIVFVFTTLVHEHDHHRGHRRHPRDEPCPRPVVEATTRQLRARPAQHDSRNFWKVSPRWR